MKKAVTAFVFMCAVQYSIAQVTEMKGIVYNHEMSGGVIVHTSGWSLFLDVARRDDYKKKNLWEFEITQLHNPKEVKQTIDFGLAFFGFSSPKPFIYGKQNSFYNVNASYGKQF